MTTNTTHDTISSSLGLTKQASDLQKKLHSQILKANPGLGDKASEMADILAESGISRALSLMIVSAVYSPDNAGRGQTTKSHWFVSALKTSSYGNRLNYIGSNKNALQRFVAEMGEIDDSRESLSTYCGFSFADCFLLSEAGISEAEAMAIMADCEADGKTTHQARRILMKAARSVIDKQCATVSGAVEMLK